jgi:hypothetical protein
VLVVGGSKVTVHGLETKATHGAAGAASSGASAKAKAKAGGVSAEPQQQQKGLLYDVAWQATAAGVPSTGAQSTAAPPPPQPSFARGSTSRSSPGSAAARPAAAATALMQTAAIAASAVAARTVGGTLNTTASSAAAAGGGNSNNGNVSDAPPVLGVVRAAAAELSAVQFDVEDRSRYFAVASASTSSSSIDDNNTLAATTLSFSGPHGAAFTGGARFRPTVMRSTRSVGLGAMQLTPQPRGALADLKPSPVSTVAGSASGESLGGDGAEELPFINVRVRPSSGMYSPNHHKACVYHVVVSYSHQKDFWCSPGAGLICGWKQSASTSATC